MRHHDCTSSEPESLHRWPHASRKCDKHAEALRFNFQCWIAAHQSTRKTSTVGQELLDSTENRTLMINQRHKKVAFSVGGCLLEGPWNILSTLWQCTKLTHMTTPMFPACTLLLITALFFVFKPRFNSPERDWMQMEFGQKTNLSSAPVVKMCTKMSLLQKCNVVSCIKNIVGARVYSFDTDERRILSHLPASVLLSRTILEFHQARSTSGKLAPFPGMWLVVS